MTALGLVVLKELWALFKDSTKENTKAIKELTESCSSLSRDISRLQIQMEYVHKDLSVIPELKRDIDAAHDAIRELQIKNGLSHHRRGGSE